MSNYYPIFINLKGKPVLVVGGGNVAFRKVSGLLECNALVTVVSPLLGSELKSIINQENCIWLCKEYSIQDLQDAELVFACTEDKEINALVAEDAKSRHCPVNVVDDPETCSFFVPSVLRRGDLSIAVATAGSSPYVARQVRLRLEELYGDEMVEYLKILRSWRSKVKASISEEKRRLFWQRVTDGQVLKLIENGQLEQAKEVVENCFLSLLA
ncbi:MAG: Siroheme synthase [Candidatus Dichloromethanomonas elyunquensis]|nr:MAG: Siroheme synthase [Candidatus Dichloromethanomonas elyunquensis]